MIIALVPAVTFAGPGDSTPELDEDFESSDSAEVDDEGSLEDDDFDESEHIPSGPTEEEIAAGEASTSELAGEDINPHIAGENDTPPVPETRNFADDCYGYPGGDSQDSSDFALKVDCILKTSNQNLSFFTYSEGETTVEDGGQAPIEKVVIKIINTLIVVIGSVSMLLIVIAGFMMITSPGNENQRSKATEILTSAIISLVVAFSSYIIVNAVVGLFF